MAHVLTSRSSRDASGGGFLPHSSLEEDANSERSSLLPIWDREEEPAKTEEPVSVKKVRVESTHRGKEMYKVLMLSVPNSLVDTVSFCASLFSVAQVGRLGYKELAAMTLGSTVYNITGLAVVFGLTSGMDTFCGQVYGAGQYAAIGIILQRACAICSILSLPCIALWTQTEPLLILLGQQPGIAALAAQYVMLCSPAIVFSSFKQCFRSYFSSQGIVLPGTLTTLLCTVLAPLYNYTFITILDMGLNGAAVAYVVEELTVVIALVILLFWHESHLPEDEKTWSGLSLDAFRGWGDYLKVALPSMAMICLDWWILEVMILLAGMQEDAEVNVAAMGLCFNTFTFVYYSVDGFGVAASTRVAHELGAGRPIAARRTTLTCLTLGLAATVAWCAVLYSSASIWVQLFTTSDIVSKRLLMLLPYVFLAVFGYSANTVLSGVLRGAGRQTLGLLVNLVCLWLVGFPAAVVLSSVLHMGPTGLWSAIALMNILQGSVLAVKVLRFDWSKEVARSQSFVSLFTPLLTSMNCSETDEQAYLAGIDEDDYSDDDGANGGYAGPNGFAKTGSQVSLLSPELSGEASSERALDSTKPSRVLNGCLKTDGITGSEQALGVTTPSRALNGCLKGDSVTGSEQGLGGATPSKPLNGCLKSEGWGSGYRDNGGGIADLESGVMGSEQAAEITTPSRVLTGCLKSDGWGSGYKSNGGSRLDLEGGEGDGEGADGEEGDKMQPKPKPKKTVVISLDFS